MMTCWLQMCTSDGIVYDIEHIVPYIRKFHRHPVSGQPLELKDLVKLNFHKNADGEYHCPVLHKVFTEHTHIAAVKPTGHVFSFEVSRIKRTCPLRRAGPQLDQALICTSHIKGRIPKC